MRIGREDNFLSIESTPIGDGYYGCKVEAVATAYGRPAAVRLRPTTARQAGRLWKARAERLKAKIESRNP
jgi:hypothetical protein